jgi:hypothetical protein
VSCRGICRTHPNYTASKKIDYSKGMKVCITCDRAIFLGWSDFHCPCCKKSLRTKPQYYGENSKQVRESTVHRL